MESADARDSVYAPHQTNEFVDDTTNDWLRDELA